MARREQEGWAVLPDEAAVERYYEKRPLPVRVVARELDALVRAAIPGARAGIKWSVPFYAKRGPIAYVSCAQKHVTFGLIRGADVTDDSGLLQGTGKSPIRKATFAAGEPVPRAVVRRWLRDARKLDAAWGKD